ncbi:hypothetical protein [Haloarcula marismortui]|uniref:Uncharacterized protein n=2 Tax=Haloarcula marismortui TaxID=2238 RepID=M0JPJ9_9EURY|nr:hypothetical protein [Haloarcula californiae]EMA09904.1 hypothetical protein C435_21070 [Haloarcula californiae ATCC 33799]
MDEDEEDAIGQCGDEITDGGFAGQLENRWDGTDEDSTDSDHQDEHPYSKATIKIKELVSPNK